ncbi:MAG: hypothetical protein BWY25_03041 [Chloroflexi bacterium ADurb.Bin222]|nr:MAG: hypothetical protein BWY25_03041 [Chloroflexi bacterium ADurb.Bin222]
MQAVQQVPDELFGVRLAQLLTISRERPLTAQGHTKPAARRKIHVAAVVFRALGAWEDDPGMLQRLMLINGPRFEQMLAAQLLDALLLRGVKIIHLERELAAQII